VQAPSLMGSSVSQSLGMACALGFGSELVPSLVKAQAKLNHIHIEIGKA